MVCVFMKDQSDLLTFNDTMNLSDSETTEIVNYEQTEKLSRELTELQEKTVGKDVLLAEVVGIESTSRGGSIALTVELPGGRIKPFKFKKPRVWSHSYRFVRLVEGYGYSSSNFAAMVEEDVKVRVRERDGITSIIVPKRNRDVISDNWNDIKENTALRNVFAGLWFFGFLWLAFYMAISMPGSLSPLIDSIVWVLLVISAWFLGGMLYVFIYE